MPRASTPTLLSLARYAKIIGIDPLHFCQGQSTLRPVGACRDIIFQYSWQGAELSDRGSREMMSSAIKEAEEDIAYALGFWPAPVWVEDERQLYPKPKQTDRIGTGLNARYRPKSIRLNWGHVVTGGTRATQLLGTATYTTIDADGDGFEELAVFVVAGVSSSLNVCEVHAYFKEYDDADSENTRTEPGSVGADPAWEVRPIQTSLSGTTLTIHIPVWELFSPQLQEALDVDVIDADDTDSYVDALVFYRVYTDLEDQVLFGWGDDLSCTDAACCWATQAGCFRANDARRGSVVPLPATYAAATESFSTACWLEPYEPDLVWFSYYAGYTDNRPTTRCDPLSDYMAETITMLASARLELPVCTCDPMRQRIDRWREDMVLVNDQRSFQTDADVFTCPFGTRVGEVQAWKRLKRHDLRLGQAARVK